MPDMNELQHWGIKGMKWGLRRYQNPDGTLTELGRKRYGYSLIATKGQVKRDLNKLDKESQSAKERAKVYTERALEQGNFKITRHKAEKLLKTANEYRKLAERDEAFKNQIKEQVGKYGGMKIKDIPTARKVELSDKLKDVLFNPHKVKTEGVRYKVSDNADEVNAINKAKEKLVNKEKEAKEQELFKTEKGYAKIHDLILAKSGNLYEGISVSNRFKEKMDELNKLEGIVSSYRGRIIEPGRTLEETKKNGIKVSSKEQKEARSRMNVVRDELASVILQDIGFEDSEQNRKMIREYYIENL